MFCEKYRIIVIKKQDGSKETVKRCAHSNQKITDDICEVCPLYKPIKIKTKQFKQPVIAPDGAIIYDPIEGIKPPPTPEDYKPRVNNPWIFDPIKSSIPETPPLGKQISNYYHAIKNWMAAGQPIRSNEEVQQIHEKFCVQCDWYDKESKRCKGCGCKVRAEGIAILNKIKMATEHCPRGFW